MFETSDYINITTDKNTQEVNSITFMMHRSKMRLKYQLLRHTASRGRHLDRERKGKLWVQMKMKTPNVRQHNTTLHEVEREQGANRKSFQVGQRLSLEKEK